MCLDFKMLVVIFASILLPGILGCCFPDKVSGTSFVIEQNVSNKFVIDYTQKKYISRPTAGPVDFVLYDLGKKKLYVKKKDGSCKTNDIAIPQYFAQCTPNNAVTNDFNLGPPGALPITAHRFQAGPVNIVISATKNKCLPVINQGEMGNGSKQTVIFVNVTDTNVNVQGLNQDVSNCA